MYRAWEYRNFYTDPFDLIPANPDEVTVRRGIVVQRLREYFGVDVDSNVEKE
jgi:hypothetical protein